MKKILYFFGTFLAIIGAGCAIGWSIYLKEWGMLAGVLILCFLAYPTLRCWVREVLGPDVWK